jgi:peptide/nickel transport system permease protein
MTKKGVLSKGITSMALVFLSLPSFWFAILLLFLFGLKLGWVPVGGWGNTWPEHIHSMLLPAFTGAIGSVGLLIRNIQSGVQKILARDYVDFARSKGLAKQIIRSRYVLKNVMVSTITLIAMRITSTLGGSVIIETVFALPGLGSLLVNAINGRDYILVQGTVLLYALIVLVVTLITDITYSFIDPRVKLQ